MALNVLEELARKYAQQAVSADRSGNREIAIIYYNKAVDTLMKIVRLYPDNPLTKVYLTMIKEYKERAEQLRNLSVSVPVEGEEQGEISIEDLIVSEKPSVTWDDIADLEHAKKAIKKAIIYPARNPRLFPLGWPRGILLYGPPGCGKTLLASAVANEIDAVFISVDAATIMSKWLGEAEKNVAKLFRKGREMAKKGTPVIIFIDEIDSLLGVFSGEVGGEVRVRNQFLKEMDGLQDKKNKLLLFVIGATNKPWKLDDAFIRRFQRRIYIPPPSYEARIELFKLYTRELKLDPSVNIRELARLTEGYSSSDIKDICQEVQEKVVEEYFEETGGAYGEPRAITMDDFIEVIKRRRPSINRELIRRYEIWTAEYGAL